MLFFCVVFIFALIKFQNSYVLWKVLSVQLISASQVTPGGKASLANLCCGDVILAIGGAATDSMTLSEGQNAILSCTQQLCFKIER